MNLPASWNRSPFHAGRVLPCLLLLACAALAAGCRERRAETVFPVRGPHRPDAAFWHADNARVARQVAAYRKSGLPETLWDRGRPYLPFIREVFREHGLPMELCLLPAIESGFRPDAKSATRAAGMWQFIPETARDQGLVVNDRRDDRLDWRLSTRAAARYLGRLADAFDDDWALVLAAYNAGPETVRQAVAAQGTRDYWRLSLRQETMDYVPRLLAMVAVLREAHPGGR